MQNSPYVPERPARRPDAGLRPGRVLLVGDDRADPVAQAGVAPDQPDRVEDEHHDEAHGDPREPVVRLGLRRLEQVVDGDGDRDHAEDRQHDVLDDAELGRPVLAVVERQGHVGREVHEQDQDRAHRAGLEEEGQRVQAVAVPPIQWPSAQPRVMAPAMRDEGDDGVDRRPADRVDPADPARQQALAPGVEDQPALGVHRGDEHAQGGGQPGQVRDEGQPGRHAVGDGDERDEGGRERRGVVVEAGDRGVGQQQVREGHEGDRQEHGPGHVAPRVVGLLGQRRRVLPADEQVDGQREGEGQAAEVVGDVAGLERHAG